MDGEWEKEKDIKIITKPSYMPFEAWLTDQRAKWYARYLLVYRIFIKNVQPSILNRSWENHQPFTQTVENYRAFSPLKTWKQDDDLLIKKLWN